MKKTKEELNGVNTPDAFILDKKSKTVSRAITRKFINNNQLLPFICKECGSNQNLEIHHDNSYPTTRAAILNEIKEGKIFRICRKCHSKITNVETQIHNKTEMDKIDKIINVKEMIVRCKNCNSTHTYVRLKSLERVCRTCGNIYKINEEDSK